jgi:1,2-dihydroxy-3-keto-5-methylthiopentene dioxygenase
MTMSHLSIYPDTGGNEIEAVNDGTIIAERLKKIGVQFERWQATARLDANAGQEEVLAAYRDSVDALNQQYQFKSMDVVSLQPDHPQKQEMRQKFLSEHTHDDFEVRFFVEGSGIFYLHVKDRVYALLCEQGDLISVPANTTHWFDMGTSPNFKCIRFFTQPDGWIGNFTGSDIANRIPDYDQYLAALK